MQRDELAYRWGCSAHARRCPLGLQRVAHPSTQQTFESSRQQRRIVRIVTNRSSRWHT